MERKVYGSKAIIPALEKMQRAAVNFDHELFIVPYNVEDSVDEDSEYPFEYCIFRRTSPTADEATTPAYTTEVWTGKAWVREEFECR